MPGAARIYMDHNSTTPLRPEARAAMEPFLAQEFGNAASLHAEGQRARAALERARATCADVLGAAPDEIVFTSGGTESNNLALRGLAWARAGQAKRIVFTEIEHSAVRETVSSLALQGFDSVAVPVGRAGVAQADRLAAALDDRTCLATLMLANNESGVIQPVAAVGRVCRTRGVPFHVDAVQGAGKLPIRVDGLCCDTLALSAHKFEGPKGAGLLYVRRGMVLAPQMTGGSHEGGLRGGTHNVAALVGMAEALRLAEAEREATAARLTALREGFERALRERIPETVIHGADAPRLPNTSFIAFPGLDGESLVIALDLEGVAVSTGAACLQGTSRTSHVLAAMGIPPEIIKGSVRFSLGRLTTESVLQEAAMRIQRVVERMTKVKVRIQNSESRIQK